MTPEMTFECLFVCQDPGLFGTVSRILRDLSICTTPCLSSSKAVGELAEGIDLIVIDWDEASSDLLREIWKSGAKQKPIVLAISAKDLVIPGVHVVLQKPVTAESGTQALKAAYSKMLQDHRRRARYALMMPVMARDLNDRSLQVDSRQRSIF